MDKGAQNEVSITKITIKKENLNDDIKEFAETAMNELLGWYGYENRSEESRKSRRCRSHSGSNCSEPTSPKYSDGCPWCGKPVEESAGPTSTMANFCSELCFSQSRRANFKKNKTCDWCHHVRNTISYVDFQDGASQLQFCSDKCLNQYKMHIFCRETRAHLELHPHLYVDDASSGTLITPDLWMKNCKSPPRRTPSPPPSPQIDTTVQSLPVPLISVAHPSKLMSPGVPESKRSRFKLQKKTRKRVSSTLTNNYGKLGEGPQDLRVRHTSTDTESSSTLVNHTSPESAKPQDKFPTRFQNSTTAEPQILNSPPLVSNQALLGKPLESLLPPPTVLVPYPIILPIPIPIPIPLPILQKNDKVKVDASSQTEDVTEVTVNSSQESSDKELVVKNNIGRPLRKRKKLNDDKSKVSKYKKVVTKLN